MEFFLLHQNFVWGTKDEKKRQQWLCISKDTILPSSSNWHKHMSRYWNALSEWYATGTEGEDFDFSPPSHSKPTEDYEKISYRHWSIYQKKDWHLPLLMKAWWALEVHEATAGTDIKVFHSDKGKSSEMELHMYIMEFAWSYANREFWDRNS